MGCGADWTKSGFGGAYNLTASGPGWQPSGTVQTGLVGLGKIYGGVLHFTSWSWALDSAKAESARLTAMWRSVHVNAAKAVGIAMK